MKKYQELESKVQTLYAGIGELQKEIERLKQKEESDKLPNNFDRDEAIAFLTEFKYHYLDNSFEWDSTPQGDRYWDSIYRSLYEYPNYKVPEEAIAQIQNWVIISFQQEEQNK
jgi:hypothetical protein